MTPSPPADGWDEAPCALLVLRADGSLLEVNRRLLDWVGRDRDELLGGVRVGHLLTVGGRIYWETHLAPLLRVEGRLDEVALDLNGADGRLPVLLSAVTHPGSNGSGTVVHVALSSAKERTRYERELLAARRAADDAAASVQVLQDATAALSRAIGVTAVADAALSAAVGPLGAAAGTLWLVDGDGALVAHSSRGEAPPPGPPRRVLLHDGHSLDRAATRPDGRIVVPLLGSAALQGVLSLAARDGLGDEPLDLAMLTALGQQAGLALDRAQLYEQSASVAHELQRALLAVEPPDDQRFAVATTYRPGVERLEVGGDWYDVFLAEEGVLSLVVGDVVGRGLPAASAMGQLRSAVRAVAGAEAGPAGLLSRLDRFVERVQAATMATIAYAELDLVGGRLRYACAGHPPPLLLPANGPPRLLWGGRSTPLGAYVAAGQRGEAVVQLEPWDRLLLYTDGLFERRDRALDEGLQLLTDTAAELSTVPLRDAVQSLTARLLKDERSRDDVCVLLISWLGGAFERQLSADLSALSAVRRALAGWLLDSGVAVDARHDLVLAASEAITNAAEHGGRSLASARVTLRARIEQTERGTEQVVLQVQDQGEWRPENSSDERGRGLTIMGALMDDVSIDNVGGTTVVMTRRVDRAHA